MKELILNEIGPLSIGNSISSSLEFGLWWFKILWIEEKKISNYVVGHFFQLSSILREKGETRLKLHLVSDAINYDHSSLFRSHLELQNSDWSGSCCAEKLTQRFTIVISISMGKFATILIAPKLGSVQKKLMLSGYSASTIEFSCSGQIWKKRTHGL